MTTWEYQNSFVSRSWDLPGCKSGRHRAFGFWLRETTDRPSAQSRFAGGFWSAELYERLRNGEIRVLTLKPGSGDDDLVGCFEVVQPQLESDYRALSYVWGVTNWDRPMTQEPIVIEAPTGQHILPLTPNLANALHHVRSASKPIRLWVDALCINQSDLTERAQQVELMTSIYREATEVLIWLGGETEHSILGMRIVEEMCRGNANSQSSSLDLPPDILRPALCDILDRPYFKRLWVVQEAALARVITMICGQSHFTWQSTAANVVSLVRHFKMAAISPRFIDAGLADVELGDFLQLLESQLTNGPDAHTWARRTRKPDLLSSAYLLRNRQTTDPRDRIYSLLGLVDEETATELRPDYTFPVEDLFAKFRSVMDRQTAELCVELSKPGATEEYQNDQSRVYDAAGEALAHSIANDASQDFLTSAESECLTAIRCMRSGDLEKATRLLGRATVILNSELRQKAR